MARDSKVANKTQLGPQSLPFRYNSPEEDAARLERIRTVVEQGVLYSSYGPAFQSVMDVICFELAKG